MSGTFVEPPIGGSRGGCAHNQSGTPALGAVGGELAEAPALSGEPARADEILGLATSAPSLQKRIYAWVERRGVRGRTDGTSELHTKGV